MKTRICKLIVLSVVSLILVGMAISCKDKEKDNYKEDCCTVKYVAPPDNCDDWMIIIEAEDPFYNVYYKPDHLPDEYKVDNSHVRITYRVSDKKHNCGFGGYVPIIEIEKIEECLN